jgi:hypothetical protein
MKNSRGINSRGITVLEDYRFHTSLIHRFVDDISHKESLLQLPFEHNCLNWILGHIVANRSHVLETVGVDHPWKDETRKWYHQGTPPVRPESGSVNITSLIDYLNQSIDLLAPKLKNYSDDWMEEIHRNYRGEKSRYQHLIGFHWHEAFHIGQLEILQAYIHSKR